MPEIVIVRKGFLPEEEMFIVCDVQVTRVLLDRGVAKVISLMKPKLIVRKKRVNDSSIYQMYEF